MHISDGVLSAPVLICGYAATAGIVAASIKRISAEDMPRIAVMTSAFFVASLIHVPLGPTSVHLVLSGLVGIILGPAAFISILVGLILQAFLFQHGGITTIGVNALMMGLPALAAYRLFGLRRMVRFEKRDEVFGFLAGFLSVLLGTLILALLLVTTGSEFAGVAKYAALANLPVMVIEGLITLFVVSFLKKVKPELLEQHHENR